MNILLLIRHGQSQSNAGEHTEHPAAAELTDIGRTQAELLAGYVLDTFSRPPDRVVTSPFIRTLQTATPLLERMDDPRHEVWPIQEYVILSKERYKHLPPRERLRQMHDHLAAGDPGARDQDCGESYSDFMARVRDFHGRMRECSGLTTVFCHGLFLRAVVKSVLAGHFKDTPLAMKGFDHLWRALAFPNTAFVTLEERSGRPGRFLLGPIESPHLAGRPELATG